MANTLKNNAASEAIAELYLNEEFADIRFSFNVNDKIQTIPANKANLAVLSPVFSKMFYGSLKEEGDVKIVDASIGAFKEFLQFFYLGEVTLTMENIETVARLADKYDILKHVNACAAFLKSKLTLDNMCWAYQLALFLKNQALIEFCEKQISKSPKEVFSSDAFRRCDEETLEYILRLPLACSETDVFNACMEWAKNACKQDGLDETKLESVKSQLGNQFKLIRFGEMTIKEFLEIHTSHKELFTLEELQDIMLQLGNTAYESKLFDQCHRDYEWNDAKVLECNRENVDGNKSKNVQSAEVISFSTNRPVLLGEIWSTKACKFDYIHRHYSYLSDIEVGVTITQIEHNSFHSNAPPKKLYEGLCDTWDDDQLKIVLPEPIFIKPQIVYEIRVTKLNPEYEYSAKWNPIAKHQDGLEIHFHQNPLVGYDNANIGYISTLKFNQF